MKGCGVGIGCWGLGRLREDCAGEYTRVGGVGCYCFECGGFSLLSSGIMFAVGYG